MALMALSCSSFRCFIMVPSPVIAVVVPVSVAVTMAVIQAM